MTDTANKLISSEPSPGRRRQLIHLGNLMMVVFDFNDGPMEEPEAPHSHQHEQISYVAGGSVIFFRGTEKFELSEGAMIAVPAGIPHCIQTLTQHVRLIDSFSPIREDFLKTDNL